MFIHSQSFIHNVKQIQQYKYRQTDKQAISVRRSSSSSNKIIQSLDTWSSAATLHVIASPLLLLLRDAMKQSEVNDPSVRRLMMCALA